MTLRRLLSRRFWLLYPSWIALCALLAALFSGVIPSKDSEGKIDSDMAARKAVTALAQLDERRFHDYDVATVAFSRSGEIGPEPRWVVLCDEPQRTGLRDAVVVELSADGGAVIRVRKAVVN